MQNNPQNGMMQSSQTNVWLLCIIPFCGNFIDFFGWLEQPTSSRDARLGLLSLDQAFATSS